MSQEPTTPMSSVLDIPVAPAAQPAQALPPVLDQRDPRDPRDQRARAQASARARGEAAQPAPRSSAFAPLLLGGLALLGWLAFQAQQQYGERQILQTAYASQQQTVDNAGKLRASLDTLAADTQRLADGGNPNARALVDELKKRGVTINSASTPPTSAASAVR